MNMTINHFYPPYNSVSVRIYDYRTFLFLKYPQPPHNLLRLRQHRFQLFRQCISQLICSHTNWCTDLLQSIFYICFVLTLTNNDTNGGILIWQFDLLVQCRPIQLHLSSIFCFKFTYFQLYSY